METFERILSHATRLFAQNGFEAVSMRDIAAACEIKAPSLYNYFPDKHSLYQHCLQSVFRQHNDQISHVFNGTLSPKDKLKAVIEIGLAQMANDPNFRLLIQRELLQNDSTRLQFLAQEVMHESCHQLQQILVELAPEADHHFVITSLMGLILFHIQIGAMRPFLPGAKEEHQQLTLLSQSIYELISTQLRLGERAT